MKTEGRGDLSRWELPTAVPRGGTAPWCWGSNEYGQLGDGSTTDRLEPVPVAGVTDLASVQSGGSSSCALTRAGAIWCWGRNSQGQLGDGSERDSPVRVHVAEPRARRWPQERE